MTSRTYDNNDTSADEADRGSSPRHDRESSTSPELSRPQSVEPQDEGIISCSLCRMDANQTHSICVCANT